MPDIVFDTLQLQQGYNPRANVQDAFGYIISLTIAGQKFTSDISAQASMVSFTSRVVAVMRYFKWAGGLTDPMQLKANFSTTNRNVLYKMLHGMVPNTNVTFGFVIFYFDQSSSVFYQAMAGSAPNGTTPLSGQIAKQGKQKLLLTLPSQLAGRAVQSPPNWEFDLTVMPGKTAQHVSYAYAPGQLIMKNWGVTVA